MTTFDLDIVHDRDPENVNRLYQALQELEAHHRFRRDLRIGPNEKALREKGQHLFMTNEGPLDVFGSIGTQDQGQDYQILIQDAMTVEWQGYEIQLQSLESLIQIKELINRDKDRQALPLIRALLKRRRGNEGEEVE